MIFLENELSTEQRDNLKTQQFGLPDERKYPLTDAAHVRSAIAYFRYCPAEKRKTLAHNIAKAAKKFNVKISPRSRVYAFIREDAEDDYELNHNRVVLEADDDDEDDPDELDARDAAMDEIDEPTDYTNMLDDEPELDGENYEDDIVDDRAATEDDEPTDYTQFGDDDEEEQPAEGAPEENQPVVTQGDENPDAPDPDSENYTGELANDPTEDGDTEDNAPEDYTQDLNNDNSLDNDINSNVRSDDNIPTDNNDNTQGEDTPAPDQGDAPDGDEPEDYTQDPGVGDDNGGMGDDVEGEDPNGEPPEGVDNPAAGGSELQALQGDVFSNLSPEQLKIKTGNVKQSFINLYNDVVEILERLSVVNKSSDNIEAINFVADTLNDLKGMLNDSIVNAFDTKSLVENQITYQRFLAVYTMTVKILEKIGNKRKNDGTK